MKTKNKRRYLKESGITLIALVVTIVVLLILAGVSINALFGNGGIIEKAKDAQNRANNAQESDLNTLSDLDKLINNQVNGTGGEDGTTSTTPKISALVDKVVDKNTRAEDAYGNKITIPKGFKILPHGTEDGSANYNYSGDNTPTVQDGIVIEDTQTKTLGNQFVWVPVGTIKNKTGDSRGTTSTITLGRYQFDNSTGTLTSTIPAQIASIENCTQEVTIDGVIKELSTFTEGNAKTDSTAENATARDLKTFIETTLANGGYYIARFEASGTTSRITSKYNQTVLTNITQPNAAKVAREMYGEVKENNELIYASDLVNSYAWDTAIIFIQTYSTETDASSYGSQNKCTSFEKAGINKDKYCNIWDMSGNAYEWTTENSNLSFGSENFLTCVRRGGSYDYEPDLFTAKRYIKTTTDMSSDNSLRALLYVKEH